MSRAGEKTASATRIQTADVVRHLARVLRRWPEQPVELNAVLVLVAGCAERIDAWEDKTREALTAAAREIVGADYADGFTDGFNCAPVTTRPGSLRYVQGLDDGGVVGRAVRWGEIEN